MNQSGKYDYQFYQYERQTLADVIMERTDGRWGLCAFLDFKRQYEDPAS
jgi:hypothetical protein